MKNVRAVTEADVLTIKADMSDAVKEFEEKAEQFRTQWEESEWYLGEARASRARSLHRPLRKAHEHSGELGAFLTAVDWPRKAQFGRGGPPAGNREAARSGPKQAGPAAVGVPEPAALNEDADVLHPDHPRATLGAVPAGLFPTGVAAPAHRRAPRILAAACFPLGHARLAQLARHLAESEHVDLLLVRA